MSEPIIMTVDVREKLQLGILSMLEEVGFSKVCSHSEPTWFELNVVSGDGLGGQFRILPARTMNYEELHCGRCPDCNAIHTYESLNDVARVEQSLKELNPKYAQKYAQPWLEQARKKVECAKNWFESQRNACRFWDGNMWVWCRTHYVDGHPWEVPQIDTTCHVSKLRNRIAGLARQRESILNLRRKKKKMVLTGNWFLGTPG